jgi:hypothetical protein
MNLFDRSSLPSNGGMWGSCHARIYARYSETPPDATRSAGRTTEIISVAGRGARRCPMLLAASSKAMDGKAPIRAEYWYLSFQRPAILLYILYICMLTGALVPATLAVATRQIRSLLAEAREEYRSRA